MSEDTDDVAASFEREGEAVARYGVDAPEAPRGFELYTEQQAEAAVDALLTHDDLLARRRAECARLERENQNLHAFYEAALDLYYAKHPPTKGKTLHFAGGAVGKRSVPGGLRIVDEAKVKAWAAKHLRAALVPSFEQNLDRERARRGLDALYAAELAAAFAAAPPELDHDEALARAEQKAQLALVAAGAEMKPDEERIYVTAPRAPRRQ